ncbi:addiction module protein [Salinimicrobium oceani]|uniref:Addiction module protein n=1 Tax=Salinimicrobium oceani TaxID=2722702 RepID=A0ABX1CUV4_9FLAO|nr:addiction module protein [Salinimicrobium oceani]NJW52068.1 addiction module protein [Salinimicrobium oceani]
MEKERLKLGLLEKIINCDDASVLKRVEEILLDYSSKASEAGEEYISSKMAALSEELNISPEQEEELTRRYRDYLEGKTEGVSWEDVRQNIKDLYGF